MRLSTDRRCVGKIAAALGILQGVAWTVMSLAAIILHNWSPDLDPPTSYRKLIEYVIYHRFIKESSDSSQGVQFIFRPEDFTILMWIYFLLSVGWVALSIDLFTAIHVNKGRQTSMMITWGTVTLIVSLIDLIFACLLGRDYSICSDVVTDSESTAAVTESFSCYLAVGIILSVAARGYTLWVVNLIFAISVIYVAANIIKENTGFGSLYSFQSIPRVKIPKSDTTGSLPRGDNNDFSSQNRNPYSAMPVRLPLFQTSESLSKPYTPQSEPELPSFLTRGDKFTY